jgi:hypothetical protein
LRSVAFINADISTANITKQSGKQSENESESGKQSEKQSESGLTM